MPVEFKNANESFLELLIRKSVAERIDGTIEVTEPVGNIVKFLDRQRRRVISYIACYK